MKKIRRFGIAALLSTMFLEGCSPQLRTLITLDLTLPPREKEYGHIFIRYQFEKNNPNEQYTLPIPSPDFKHLAESQKRAIKCAYEIQQIEEARPMERWSTYEDLWSKLNPIAQTCVYEWENSKKKINAVTFPGLYIENKSKTL